MCPAKTDKSLEIATFSYSRKTSTSVCSDSHLKKILISAKRIKVDFLSTSWYNKTSMGGIWE